MNSGLLRFLVTAGPTREALDPVRFLSNRSSGKMGYAIAEAAVESGYETILISGPVALKPPGEVRLIRVESSDEMFAAVAQEIVTCDIFVMCAAVADYKPAEVCEQKLGKRQGPWMLALEPTRDILATVPRGDRVKLIMGFAAETQDVEVRAKSKLLRKRCDLLVANDVSSSASGMESDFNAATVFGLDGSRIEIERTTKVEMARTLLKIIACHQKKIDYCT